MNSETYFIKTTVLSTTEAVSPVTLSEEWSRVARLLLLTSMSVIGSVGNIFMISAVIIEDHLKKRGNSFIVNIALADILITGLVFPVSTVVILAEPEDKNSFCNFQWFLAQLSCLVTVLTLLVTSLENYSRLFLSPECYNNLTPTRITITILLIWVISINTVTIQFLYDLGPDYCRKTSSVLFPYQIVMGSFFIFIPAAFTCLLFILIVCKVRKFKAISSLRQPVIFTFEYELVKTNLLSFLFFIIFWLPFLIVLCCYSLPNISRRLFYNLAWFALSKSCVNNFIYCVCNRRFRSAYVNLFHYCCCKTTVSFSRRQREPVRPTGDVRVHIIPAYNMYSYTSPQRHTREAGKNNSSKRTGGGGSCRANGRDVYEL